MKNISVPFRFVGGRVATTSNTDTIARQKIVDVLVTSPAERMGQPTYGAGIYALLFEPIDELVKSDFRVDALQELNSRISGVTIYNLDITQNPIEPSLAEVEVTYSLPLSPVQQLTFTINTALTEESPL